MANLKIHTFSSQPNEFLVNSFIIETDKGLILIDSQFLVSPALKVRKIIEDLKKPLSAVFITHPHPDHFNGVSVILEERNDVPVIATAETLKFIKMTEADKRTFWTPHYGNEYPKKTRFPDKIITSGESIKINGLDIIIDDLGPVESSDTTIISLPNERILFASDLVYNDIHPWLAEGRSGEWFRQIDLVKARYAQCNQVYAGHGIEGNIGILSRQADYIKYFRDQILGNIEKGSLNAEGKSKIINNMKSAFKGFELDFLIDMNIDGVLKEILAGAHI